MTTPLHEAGTIALTHDGAGDAAVRAHPRSSLVRHLARLAHAVGHVMSRSLGGLAHDAGLPTFL